MTGKLIQMPGNAHRDIQTLLPWYVTGQLDAAEHARIDAHLRGCAECRGELDQERRLDVAITRMPNDVDQGWALMRTRIEDEGRGRGAAVAAFDRRSVPRSWRRWLGWGLAAQVAVAAMVIVAVVPPRGEPASYRALGAAETPATGNLIVIFQPDTSERVLRQTLRDSDARLVDGPTAANAYVLQVPDDRRATLLAGLRRNPRIVLAEAIDPGQRP